MGISLLDSLILQVATTLSAVATWEFAGISKIGWKWTGVIWIYNIVTYMLLDPIKFAVRYALSGRAWGLVYNKRVSEMIIELSLGITGLGISLASLH